MSLECQALKSNYITSEADRNTSSYNSPWAVNTEKVHA